MPRQGAAPIGKRDGLLARAVDWVFGYDFFVSYSHSDGLGYPRRLRERLEEGGFRVFLDQTDYVAGQDLRRETRRQVEKSRKIVIVGRPQALSSEWVKREVDVALERDKIPVIIDINNAVKSAPQDAEIATMARDSHWLRLVETVDDADGSPSDHTVGELIRGFGHTTQQTKRQRVLAAAVAVLATTTGLATWQAIEARRQQAIAERNFEVARTAADGLVIDLARGLKDVEGMRTDSLRKILTRAEAAFNTLAAAAPGDLRLLQGRAAMYNEFVETYLARGDTVDAKKAAEESVALAERLVAASANDTAARRQLALGFVKLGDAMAEVGEWTTAKSAYDRALAIRRALVGELPDELVAQRDVAISLARLGNVAENLGTLSIARDLYVESLAIRDALAARRPDWRRDVVLNRIVLGDVLLELGEHDRAGAEFDAAVELSRALRDADPPSTRALRDHAVALQRRGNHASKLGDLGKARSAYEQSKAAFLNLSAKDERNIEWRRDVAVSIGKLAKVARADGDPAAARGLLAEVVRVRRELLSASEDNRLLAIDLAEALKDQAVLTASQEAGALWREVRERLETLDGKQVLTPEQRGWLDLARQHDEAAQAPTERAERTP